MVEHRWWTCARQRADIVAYRNNTGDVYDRPVIPVGAGRRWLRYVCILWWRRRISVSIDSIGPFVLSCGFDARFEN